MSAAKYGMGGYDALYMKKAIQLARQNPDNPFAALIVRQDDGRVLTASLNAVHLSPTFHGEIVAINDCAQAHPQLDWSKVTLYSTAEPCPMCYSAIMWAGIPRVVFAASMKVLKQFGWHHIAISPNELQSKAAFYQGTILGGVLGDEAASLFKQTKCFGV